MKVGRRIWLVMAVALSSMGCRAAGTGSLSLFPRPASTLGSLDVEEFVAQHNRNAESIQSLEGEAGDQGLAALAAGVSRRRPDGPGAASQLPAPAHSFQ